MLAGSGLQVGAHSTKYSQMSRGWHKGHVRVRVGQITSHVYELLVQTRGLHPDLPRVAQTLANGVSWVSLTAISSRWVCALK